MLYKYKDNYFIYKTDKYYYLINLNLTQAKQPYTRVSLDATIRENELQIVDSAEYDLISDIIEEIDGREK